VVAGPQSLSMQISAQLPANETDETVVVCLIRRACNAGSASAKRFAQGNVRLRIGSLLFDSPGRNITRTRSCWT